jgi:hypothetical protein
VALVLWLATAPFVLGCVAATRAIRCALMPRWLMVWVPVPPARETREVPALPAAPEPPRRGDLVDILYTPNHGVVVCVDGPFAWCRRIKTATQVGRSVAIAFTDELPHRWPLQQLAVRDRGYHMPAVH